MAKHERETLASLRKDIAVLREVIRAEQKKSEQLLEYMSTHDFLTDLPNRMYLERQIDQAIQCASDRGNHMALLYLDLDNFKLINDTLGHRVGDMLLKEVSVVLQQGVRSGDFVARMGGDEFALVLNDIKIPDRAATVARLILDKLRMVFSVDGKEVYINASIGIAVYPIADLNAVELLKHADMAMYTAKTNGKNQYQFYSTDLNRQNEQMLQIINGLRNAVQNKELFLQYQPIIDINSERCCGVETLMRWEHPQLGLILPDQFLPYINAAGEMVTISQWVIHQALEDYDKLHFEPPWFMSVNVSADELGEAETLKAIMSCFRERCTPKQLVVELTETSIMRHPEESIEKLKYLSDMGVQIAIDDYGTGYSSLSLLKQLPISLLKIDKSFIDDIDKETNNMIIIESTIRLAHRLGIKVIAEGVETEAQLVFLKQHACDYVQGYYLSMPLSFHELLAYIAK